MLRAVVAALSVGLTVYALIDCARADPGEVRTLPKPLWLLVVLLLPVLGPIAWLVVGRSRRGPGPKPRTRPVAPDDDPEFLRELERRRRRQAQDERLQRWEDGRPDPDGGADGEDRAL